MYHNVKAFYLITNYDLSVSVQKASSRSGTTFFFQQSYDNVGNLEALEIHVSKMIPYTL